MTLKSLTFGDWFYWNGKVWVVTGESKRVRQPVIGFLPNGQLYRADVELPYDTEIQKIGRSIEDVAAYLSRTQM